MQRSQCETNILTAAHSIISSKCETRSLATTNASKGKTNTLTTIHASHGENNILITTRSSKCETNNLTTAHASQCKTNILTTTHFLRNIIVVYFNKGRGMDNCPYHLHIS
jgi:hypothetical protein